MPTLPFPLAGPLGPSVLQALPIASFSANPSFGVIGSIIKLDATASSDPTGLPLIYLWSFVDGQIPIGSKVNTEGFRTIETNRNVVTFSPDIVGEYIVSLVVTNGSTYSVPVTTRISIRAIMVPHGRGLIPDGKFIWSYIRDVWTQVEGKEWFETLWSALIQISGSDLLKLYQNDFNKSIRDIQDFYQRRWIAYEPRLDLNQDDLTMYIGYTCAGTDASTIPLGLNVQCIPISANELIISTGPVLPTISGEKATITSSQNAVNQKSYIIQGLNKNKTGYLLQSNLLSPLDERDVIAQIFYFSTQSTSWTIIGGAPTAILINDVIVYSSGPNKGQYRVLTNNGTTITVDNIPPSFSDVVTSVTFQADVYRPMQVTISQPDIGEVNSFSVIYSSTNDLSQVANKRVMSVGGRGVIIQRSLVDSDEINPLTIVTTDKSIAANMNLLNWRVGHTLLSSSQDFESLGVTVGDLLEIDLFEITTGMAVTIATQVTAVDGSAISVVITDQELTPGVLPPIPNSVYITIADTLKINSASNAVDGSLVLTGLAAELNKIATSLDFKRTYGNKELTVASILNVGDFKFQLKPKAIIRNSCIPVDSDLKSIPVLQEYIVQPTTTVVDGDVFQVKGDKTFLLPRTPAILFENNDFTISNDILFKGTLTFTTGSTTVISSDGFFLDRGIQPGDSFEIESPLSLAGIFTIKKVISPTTIIVTRKIPAFALASQVTASVIIKKRLPGTFLRFVPGAYAPNMPAPNRLWAEISFFDNSSNIENNFGVLVGLTREDLNSTSSDLSYRQAVSGLMFALTKGSSLDKIKLGIQILIGLPFSEHRGIIRSIETNYRLDDIGNSILGRIFIEDIDDQDAALGTFRIYTYPITESAIFSGLEISPITNLPYVIGDIVEQFTPLSKGIIVSDYLTDPLGGAGSYIKQLQQFQSLKVRIDDAILSPEEIILVSDFLKKITPSYIAYYITTTTDIFDLAQPTDATFFKVKLPQLGMVDNASFGVPGAIFVDNQDLRGSIFHTSLDNPYVWSKKSGFDAQTTFNLVTQTITVPSGGLSTPNANETFQSPLVGNTTQGIGDLLYIRKGSNFGAYIVTPINNTSMTVTPLNTVGFAAGASVLATDTGITYSVNAQVSPLVALGTSITTVSTNVVRLGNASTVALRNAYVSPGDTLHVANNTTRYTILSVVESTPGSGIWDTVTVTPTPTFGAGASSWRIFRLSLYNNSYSATITWNTAFVAFTHSDPFLDSLMDYGDYIMGPDKVQHFILDPLATPNKQIVPGPPDNSTVTATLVKKRNFYSDSTASSILTTVDYMKLDPSEFVDLRIHNISLGSVTGSQFSQIYTLPISGATLNIRVGDFFQALNGSELFSTNTGYGTGIFPIQLVTGTSIFLNYFLVGVSETITDWKIIRRLYV